MLNRLAVLAILFASVAMAQEQDQTMINRIINVDRAKAFTVEKKQYKTDEFSSSTYKTGEFSGVKSARTSEFRTRSFLGIRNPWFGRKVYETKAGRELTKYVLHDKAFSSRRVDTRIAPDAERQASQDGKTASTRSFLGRGKAQAAIDAEHPTAAPLTIEEVREVLNKNR